MKQTNKRQFIITKKIAKQRSKAIIVIPRILESQLKPGTVTQVTIDIIENREENNERRP